LNDTEPNAVKQSVNQPINLFNVDLKRVIFLALRYWYVFFACLALSLIYAYFKTRYATRIFPVTASIIIKQKEESSEGKLLYNNPLVSGFRNYQDELYLIRTYPLIQRTLEELNFGVAFYWEGNVLTTEVYDAQIKATVIKSNGDHRFYFKMLNEQRFQLFEKGENPNAKTYSIGDTVSYNGISFVFSNNAVASSKIPDNEPVLFVYSNPANLTESYVGSLQAAWAEEGAGVMNLSINGSIPKKDIDFLKGLINVYQKFDLEKKNQAASRTIEFINQQLSLISDSLRLAEGRLELFRNKNVAVDMIKETERIFNQISGFEEQRAQILLKENYFKYLVKYLESNTSVDKVVLPSSVGINDPILFSLVSRMIDLQLLIKGQYGSENPLIGSARAKIGDISDEIIEAVRSHRSSDRIKMDYLDSQVMRLEKQLNSLPSSQRKLVSIQRSYSLLENLYIFLSQKRAEAGISRASNTSGIEIVNPPMQAGGAISPRPFQNYAFAVGLGLLVPALLFVILELLNSKVQSKEDVEKITSIPFIGGIGHKKGNNNLEVLTNPKNSISESFRALRSDLTFFLGKNEKAVIMITSSISGEGKTFTSINLASVISLSGKKTLIVGADLRKPKLYDDFNLSNDMGLSSYLAEMADFDSIVKQTAFAGLDLISGGPVPPNPSELLLTAKMRDFLTEAKRRYDFVIIDTPPLAIISDAFSFVDYSDHVIFVIRQNYTPIGLLRTLQETYQAGKLKNVSIVLNDISVSGPGYGYGYGYGYGTDTSKKKNGYGYYSQS
jgi:capsular exopolysaccharide synthesis family protein